MWIDEMDEIEVEGGGSVRVFLLAKRLDTHTDRYPHHHHYYYRHRDEHKDEDQNGGLACFLWLLYNQKAPAFQLPTTSLVSCGLSYKSPVQSQDTASTRRRRDQRTTHDGNAPPGIRRRNVPLKLLSNHILFSSPPQHRS